MHVLHIHACNHTCTRTCAHACAHTHTLTYSASTALNFIYICLSINRGKSLYWVYLSVYLADFARTACTTEAVVSHRQPVSSWGPVSFSLVSVQISQFCCLSSLYIIIIIAATTIIIIIIIRCFHMHCLLFPLQSQASLIIHLYMHFAVHVHETVISCSHVMFLFISV